MVKYIFIIQSLFKIGIGLFWKPLTNLISYLYKYVDLVF